MSTKTKHYKITKTKKLIKQLRGFISDYEVISNEYWRRVGQLEKEMAEVTRIEDIEFFHCDGEMVGIGNGSRTMELIQRHDIK